MSSILTSGNFSSDSGTLGICRVLLFDALGGSLELGETDAQEAAARELREETSLQFDPNDMEALFTYETKGSALEHTHSRMYTVFGLTISSCDFEVYEGAGKVHVPFSGENLDSYNVTPSAIYALNQLTGWKMGYYDSKEAKES